jgi:RNA polymerase sigma factor (sigma-70 family)
LKPEPLPPPAATDDDTSLVARCRQGEAAAWAALVHKYQRLVYAVVMRVGFDEHGAADVFQTVFARLLRHLPKLEQPDRLQAWIVTTAKREALRVRHVGQRTVSLTRDDDGDGDGRSGGSPGIEDTLADDAPLAEEALSDLQQLHRLRLGLDRLDARCRDLLTMLFADDEDRPAYDEVARRMAMPAGSIGPTRARCLGKLRQLVEAVS